MKTLQETNIVEKMQHLRGENIDIYLPKALSLIKYVLLHNIRTVTGSLNLILSNSKTVDEMVALIGWYGVLWPPPGLSKSHMMRAMLEGDVEKIKPANPNCKWGILPERPDLYEIFADITYQMVTMDEEESTLSVHQAIKNLNNNPNATWANLALALYMCAFSEEEVEA